ncbi:hypothetical protein KR026_001025 [Drosophila bipectinata]|nr:hypothetical protein KR026_001025 [Drosophila bipectinata]
MDFAVIKHIFSIRGLKIDPFIFVLCGFLFAMVFAYLCYLCHQCGENRRRARIKDQELPAPLARLSIGPRCPNIARTKLTHSLNMGDAY